MLITTKPHPMESRSQQLPSALSFCFWMKFQHQSTTPSRTLNTILSFQNFNLAVNDTSIQLQSLQPKQTLTIPCSISSEQWHHICIGGIFKNTTTVFLNGRPFFSQAKTLSITPAVGCRWPTSIGVGFDINSANSSTNILTNFYGEISQLYLMKGTVTRQDVSRFLIGGNSKGHRNTILSWLEILKNTRKDSYHETNRFYV